MKGKASTAALRPILQSRPSFRKCSPCHPASGHLSRESESSRPRHLLRTVASRHNSPSVLLLNRRVSRPRGNSLVVFQGVFRKLNGFFQLRIVPAHHQVRPLVHDIVGVDAVLFDYPFAAIVRAPEAEARRRDESAVAQRRDIADADQSSPGARPDNGSDFFAAEEPRKGVAA